MFKVLIIMLL